MREAGLRGRGGGLRNNSSDASTVSLDGKATTLPSAGQTKLRGSEAHTGSTGCKAYVVQAKINNSNQIFSRTVYYIT
jgi:hypothetical protein